MLADSQVSLILCIISLCDQWCPIGRQMFEKDMSLALSDAKFLTEDDMESGQQDDIEVDESLFENMDDLTLDTDT